MRKYGRVTLGPPPKEPTPSDATTVRHIKRGTLYSVLGPAKLQVEPGVVLQDMDELVVYASETDGTMWVRSKKEFDDGRFEIYTHDAEDDE